MARSREKWATRLAHCAKAAEKYSRFKDEEPKAPAQEERDAQIEKIKKLEKRYLAMLSAEERAAILGKKK